MEIKLSLALPRDELSVPVVRRILKSAMDVLGVEASITADVELALTEACTNVLKHADAGQEYVVSAGIDGDRCVVEIFDRGPGFDGEELGLGDAAPSAEDGRGIQLMRALVDRVNFETRDTVGTVVVLEKRLEWGVDSVIHKLSADKPDTEDGPWSSDSPAETPEPV